MNKTYLFLANGFEDIEALAVVDILRRGGVEVLTVAIADSLEVTSAHGVTVKADTLLKEVLSARAECLIFPGGMPGAEHLGNCKPLMEWMQSHYDAEGRVAAICAAPAMVLSQLNTGRRLRLTSYPGFEQCLPDAEVLADGVVVDGRVITGKGPGFAVPFGLAILRELRSVEVADTVAAGMLLA